MSLAFLLSVECKIAAGPTRNAIIEEAPLSAAQRLQQAGGFQHFQRSQADVGCDATDALCTYWGIQQEESVKDMDLVPDLEAECATDLLRAKALFIMKIRDKRKLLQEKRDIKRQHILEEC